MNYSIRDHVQAGQYYSADYLRVSNLDESATFQTMYRLEYAKDKAASDADVISLISEFGEDDSSVVFVVRESSPMPVKDTSNQKTPFGEMAVAGFSPHTGWSFQYNINSGAIRSTETTTGTVSHDGTFAKLSTGTGTDGAAKIETRRPLVYSSGIGAVARFTCVFDTPKEGSHQIIGVGNETDGWFFGYDGLKFGVMKRRNSIDEWYYQEDWSESKMPWLIPQFGNVYEIRYQWLGFGMQYFAVENNTGQFEDVHHIPYANENIQTSINNPSMPIKAEVMNIGNDTDIVLKTPSAVGGLFGVDYPACFTALLCQSIEKTIANGSNYLFSIRNPSEYFSKHNRLYLAPLLFSASAEGNKPVVFEVILNSTLVGAVWSDVDVNTTPAQLDTSATAWSGGRLILSLALQKSGNQVIAVGNSFQSPHLQSGEVLSVFARSTSSSDVSVGVTYRSRI